MYDVLDVSRCIINYCNERGYPISNLKLQKLLYFVQAFFLVNKNQPCFSDVIEAWQWGPVVPRVYHEFKWYGSENIPPVSNIFGGIFPPEDILPEDEQRIKKVVDDLARYSASNLVEATHQQDPWKNAYNAHQSNVISQDNIKMFFEKK